MFDTSLVSTSFLSGRRTRPERTPSEINLLLRAHTAKTAMAYFDLMSPEDREKVRDGSKVVKGYDWQLRKRDELGRFKA